MQLTMMATPNINKELHYLNKEDRLLRWLLVKHRGVKYGLELMKDDDTKGEFSKLRSSIFNDEDSDEEEDDSDDDVDDVSQVDDKRH